MPYKQFNLGEFINGLKENKPFICILLFLSYITGLTAFYHYNTLVVANCFTGFILILLFAVIFGRENLKSISPFFILFLYLLFVFGYLNAKFNYVSYDDFSNIEFMKNIKVEGTVKNIPNCSKSKKLCKFSLKADKAFLNNREYEIHNSLILVSMKTNDGVLDIKSGDKISAKGTISTPLCATNPSQFDYQKFLQNKGILKTFYITDFDYKIISSPDIKNIKYKNSIKEKFEYFNIVFTRFMNDLRDGVILKHSKYIKSPELEILGGIVFGDDAVNPPDTVKESFRNSGLLHLLAASGLNVALILSMWLCIVHFINIPYKLKIISGIFIIFLYAVMTGFPPSITRASVMFVLMLFGKLMYREANGISLIFAAGLLILFFKPEFLNDVGFQLSFLVTLGLIICIPVINHLLSKRERKFIRKIKKFNKLIKSFLLAFSPLSVICIVLVPLIAQLWAAPLTGYYFNTFSPYSVFANIAVVPFIGMVSFLGFISTAFCFIPFVSDIFLPVPDFILNYAIKIILNISNFFSLLPFSTIKISAPNPFMILTFYILIILFFLSLKFLFKRKILNYSFLFVLLIFSVQFINFEDKKTEIIFFDVKNGDNCLVKTVNNKYLMIDTGKTLSPSVSSAKTITLEYLYDKNIKTLDYLIVTHFDSDHSGGLIDILENIKVKNLIIPNPVCNSKNSCRIKKYIEENNIKYITPFSKQRFIIDNDTEIVNYVPNTNNLRSKNDFSTVTFLKTGGFKALFTADAGIKAYYSIEKFMPHNINILKSAHHGAKNTVNDRMLKKLNPEYSIISTGKNSYGHPDIETIQKLKSYSTVLSTKEKGAIKFEIKENKVKPFSYNGKKKKFEEIKKE